MKKILRTLLAVAVLAVIFSAFTPSGKMWAAEEGAAATAHEESAGEEAHGDTLLPWKIANFAIFLGIIVYFTAKNAPAFFKSRTEGIRKSIDDGARRSAEAQARATEIDRKLSGLSAEVEAMRAEAQDESSKEAARIEAETRQMLAKIQDQAQQQIALSARAAQQELRAYAADLAIQMARGKIAAPLPADIDRALVMNFVASLPKDAGSQRPVA